MYPSPIRAPGSTPEGLMRRSTRPGCPRVTQFYSCRFARPRGWFRTGTRMNNRGGRSQCPPTIPLARPPTPHRVGGDSPSSPVDGRTTLYLTIATNSGLWSINSRTEGEGAPVRLVAGVMNPLPTHPHHPAIAARSRRIVQRRANSSRRVAFGTQTVVKPLPGTDRHLDDPIAWLADQPPQDLCGAALGRQNP
jgi:hypothetical protein